MGRIAYQLAVGITVAALIGGLCPKSDAGISLITDATGLTDTIDWGQLGPDFTDIPSPANGLTSSAPGLTANASMPSGSFGRKDEGTSWFGNFTVGDHLLLTQNNGPITINFSHPIFGVGMQIQPNNIGAFTAQIEAFNSSAASLGAFTEAGTSTMDEDGLAIFIGVLDTAQEISSIRISIIAAPLDFTNDFAIGELRLTPGEAQAVVPEPSTFTVSSILLGIFGGVWLRKRRRQPATAA